MSKFLKYFLISIGCIYIVSRMPVFAWGFSEDNYYDEYYYGDEPDITDGDLEDKLADWGICEEMFPDEIFGENFYDAGLPEDKYNEWYDEYERSGMCAEDFIENKSREYYSDKNNWTEGDKRRFADSLNKKRREIIPGDVKDLYGIRINGQVMSIDQIMEQCDKASGGQITKSNAKSYDPNEEPFLKNLCEQYGEDLLTTVEVYYYGKPCRYNKETKMFEVRDRIYY